MSKSIRTDIVINAAKERVWEILTTFNDYHSWNPFITRSRGVLQVGTKLENTMLNGGKTFVFKPRILKVVPFQYFDWLGSLGIRGIFDGHHYFEIEELSPTQVKLSQGEHFSGLLSGYLLRRIGDDTRNNFIRMNQAVKALAEQQ